MSGIIARERKSGENYSDVERVSEGRGLERYRSIREGGSKTSTSSDFMKKRSKTFSKMKTVEMYLLFANFVLNTFLFLRIQTYLNFFKTKVLLFCFQVNVTHNLTEVPAFCLLFTHVTKMKGKFSILSRSREKVINKLVQNLYSL